jgi:hypothetical protein
MSALPPRADMCGAPAHACFGPIADIIIQLPHRTIKNTFVLTSDGLSAVRESSIIGAVCFEHRRHV